MTRRELLGMASVGVVALAVAGRYALIATAPKAPEGNFPVHHTDAEWHALLSPAAYNVLRNQGTETPFSSPLLSEHRAGIFTCGGWRYSICSTPAPNT